MIRTSHLIGSSRIRGGSNWGEEGYVRVLKGSNQCLITEYPTSAVVNKKDLTNQNEIVGTVGAISGYYSLWLSGNDSTCQTAMDTYFETNLPQQYCMPYLLGGKNGVLYSMVTSMTDSNITFTLYNQLQCTGVTTTQVISTNQCIQSTSGYIGYYTLFPAQVYPSFTVTLCNQSTGGCNEPQSYPQKTNVPYFLGGYAVAYCCTNKINIVVNQGGMYNYGVGILYPYVGSQGDTKYVRFDCAGYQ